MKQVNFLREPPQSPHLSLYLVLANPIKPSQFQEDALRRFLEQSRDYLGLHHLVIDALMQQTDQTTRT